MGNSRKFMSKEKEIHETRPFLCNNLQGFQGIGEGVP